MTTRDTPRVSVSPALVATGGERQVLESFLDFHRGVVVGKVRGLSRDDARRRLVPSLTTPAGIVKHLTVVERYWFGVLLGDQERAVPGTGTGHGDESWTIDSHVDIDALITRYVQQCSRSRQHAKKFTLDEAVSHPELGHVSVRWIYAPHRGGGPTRRPRGHSAGADRRHRRRPRVNQRDGCARLNVRDLSRGGCPRCWRSGRERRGSCRVGCCGDPTVRQASATLSLTLAATTGAMPSGKRTSMASARGTSARSASRPPHPSPPMTPSP
jgi:hypothetical protein